MALRLTRPLVFCDLETTGTDIVTDRIVQIALMKVHPDDDGRPVRISEQCTHLLNPGRPIPQDATAIHGITDGDVRDKPRFAELADTLHRFFDECDLAGYNANAFDVPFLVEEFARCGRTFPNEGTRLIDVCIIFKRKEARTLSAAYRFYCGKVLENAHDAEADVRATLEVFQQQLTRYDDLNALSLDELHAFCNPASLVDYARYLTRDSKGDVVFNFGKHKGKPVGMHPDYVRWMLERTFPEATKAVLRRLLEANDRATNTPPF